MNIASSASRIKRSNGVIRSTCDSLPEAVQTARSVTGSGADSRSDLVRQCLGNRPDRRIDLLVGERPIRRAEPQAEGQAAFVRTQRLAAIRPHELDAQQQRSA